jgi:hypothetical protein
MQDPIYRMATAMNSMGYTQEPTLTHCLEATSPGLNVTFMKRSGGTPACRVVVSAPLDAAVAGEVELDAGSLRTSPESFPANVPPGERLVRWVTIDAGEGKPARGWLRARIRVGEKELRGAAPFRLDD